MGGVFRRRMKNPEGQARSLDVVAGNLKGSEQQGQEGGFDFSGEKSKGPGP